MDTPEEGGLKSVLTRLGSLFSLWRLNNHVGLLYQGMVRADEKEEKYKKKHLHCTFWRFRGVACRVGSISKSRMFFFSLSLSLLGGYFSRAQHVAVLKDSILEMCAQVCMYRPTHWH